MLTGKRARFGNADNFNNERPCPAARAADVDLAEICPLDDQEKLFPGSRDPCELCQYFGITNHEVNPETGKKQFHFEMTSDTVTRSKSKTRCVSFPGHSRLW